MDIGYTFYQHQTKAFDGDLVPIVLPSDHYKAVMDDPFGWKVITQDSVYAAPNRFFVHFYIYNFFRKVPQGLQTFLQPITSIYTAAAISKTLIHILMISLLAMLVSGAKRIYQREFLLAAVIITPLFQTGGHFYKYIGIVDQSITYSSFYALPISLLMLFLFPYFKHLQAKTGKVTIAEVLIMSVLLIVLPFSGPLIPGIVLVLAFLTGSYILFKKIKKKEIPRIVSLPKSLVFFFLLLVVLCLYSIFIGQNNLESQSGAAVSLFERYIKLPQGLFYMLTQKLAYPLLLLMIVINLFIHKKYNKESKPVFRLFQCLLLFALVYLLLLPLGGFREYRPFILRKDTFLPVALVLIYFYAFSSFLIIRKLVFTYKPYYIGLLVLFLLTFTFADELDPNVYHCERKQLTQISKSNELVVKLPADCTVLSWELIKAPKDSEEQSRLLEFWNISKENQRFYQE